MPKGIYQHKKGYKLLEEHKKNISEGCKRNGIGKWMKDRKLSNEIKKKISKSSIDKHYYWLDKKLSEEHKRKIGLANKGQKRTKETRKKMSESRMGMKFTDEHRRNIGLKSIGRIAGNKNPNYIDGRTSENAKIRVSIEYRLWREAVFARDNWTCQKTGIKGGKLHPHHIQNFSKFHELRFAIDNGITLSEKAHKEFHKKYGIKNNTKEQIEEFLR